LYDVNSFKHQSNNPNPAPLPHADKSIGQASSDEAFARLKGLIASDPSLIVTEMDDAARYVRAEAQRTYKGQDEIEFLVRDDDRVVIFRSHEKDGGSIPDFGANRARIESMRKRSGGFFDLNGGTGLPADGYDPTQRNGLFGELKAFYGFQSGQGFEDVFDK